MADVQYASNGKGNLGVTLGAIGTGLGAMAGAGGLAGIFGGNRSGDPQEKPVTRYEMGLIQENTLLKANQYADVRANGLQAQIGQQAVWNATQEGVLHCQAQQLQQLYSLTKLTIPNGNVSPGWGPVAVVPVEPIVAVPPVAEVAVTEKVKAKV